MPDVVTPGATTGLVRKYRDMGNGTYARVVYNVTPGSGITSDKFVVGKDFRAYLRKSKDMGDGTFAPIIVGVGF